jgi:transketolase
MVGDADCLKGHFWEASVAVEYHRLDTRAGIVDHTQLQIAGFVEDVISITPLRDKWKAFRWHALEIDYHDMPQILDALDEATAIRGQPKKIITHTAKSKVVFFMENVPAFHGKVPGKDGCELAQRELLG